MQRVLDDPETAPIDERVRATLRFLRKMTRDHGALGPEDARAVLAAGVSKRALYDAIHVAYLFGVFTRLADVMGWRTPPAGDPSWAASAKSLLSRGYRL